MDHPKVGLEQTGLFAAETVRTKPDPLPLGVWIVMACALPSVSPCGLPCDALPLGGHDVLALVATERDPEHGVVSVGDGPFADVVSDRQGIFSIEVGVPICCVCIRRVKKNAGHPIVKGWRRSHNSVPIATANADVSHSVAQLGEDPPSRIADVGTFPVDTTSRIADVGTFPVDPPSRIADVGTFPVDTHSRIADVGTLNRWFLVDTPSRSADSGELSCGLSFRAPS